MSEANVDTNECEYQLIQYRHFFLNIGTNVAGSKHCIRLLLLDAAKERINEQYQTAIKQRPSFTS